MLTVHVLDRLYRHSSNVAHGVEVPVGARLLFTNGQVGTKPDGTTPETAAAQAEVAFERLREVLKAARMGFADVVRFSTNLMLITALGSVVCFAISGTVVLRALRKKKI